jgi:uncharacterized protein (TIGR03437 family)
MAVCAFGQRPQPHAGWKLVPGAEDLIAGHYWDQAFLGPLNPTEIQVSNGTLTATAVNSYEGGPNLVAPRLMTKGDFGVLATFQTGAGQEGWLSLTGQLTTPTSSDANHGKHLIQIGVEPGGQWSIGYWMGGAPGSDFYQWLKSFSAPPTGTLTVELLRQSGQLTAYFNGTPFGPFPDPGLFSNGFVIPGFNVAPGNKLTLSQFAFEVPDTGTEAKIFNPTEPLTIVHAGDSLGSLAAATGRTYGVAFTDPGPLSNGFSNTKAPVPDTAFAPAVLGEFNQIVNATMYYNFIESAQGVYAFGAGDSLYAIARNNGLATHCHHLIGPNIYNPSWLLKGTYTADQLTQILRTHIQTVVSHFKGQCGSWDVVNEGLNSDGTVDTSSANIWGHTIGASYIDIAFQAAHEADPNAKLYYNDNYWNTTATASHLATFVAGLQQRGVPIDGVGLQCHWTPTDAYPGANLDQATMEADIAQFARLGLKVRMSELDARAKLPFTAAAQAAQTTVLTATVQACLNSPNCVNITNWQVDDDMFDLGASYNNGYGYPAMFDAAFQPKASYRPVMNALRAAAQNVATAPKLTAAGVANAASYANTGVAPGEIVTIYASNIGPATLTGNGLDANGKVVTAIAGTRVLFDGIPAPMIYAVRNQVSAVVPYEIAGNTSTEVQVEYNGIRSVSTSVPVLAAVPGFLTLNAQGTGLAVALNQDGTLNSSTNPAARGSVVTLWATGEGQRSPAGVTGAPAPAYAAPVLTASATLGGVAANLFYAASAPGFVGLMQVNLTVPDGLPAGAAALVLSVGTAHSPAGVTLAVK